MTYLVNDLLGFILSTLIAPLIFYAPGFGIIRAIGPSCETSHSYQRFGWAAILALAILPTVDVLLIRFAGMPIALIANTALAIYGAPILRGTWRHLCVTLWGAAPFIIWWLICVWTYLDFDLGESLYQSIVSFDMVKHAAVVEQIARHGIPFSDPFFARDGIAGYYHYFYVWPAALRWLSGFMISASVAFAATAFWTGIAIPSLLWRIAADAKLIRPGRERRVAILAIFFCFLTGADLLFMAFRFWLFGSIEPSSDQWNVEVRFMATSVLWVPHHLTAVVAGWTGMLLALRAKDSTGDQRFRFIASSGLAFSTMFGASIWVAFTLAPLLAIWAVLQLLRRDLTLAFAGAIALLCALPQIADLLHGRMGDAPPIKFAVRYFSIFFLDDDLTSQLMRVLLLPANYATEFGIFAAGSIIYWRSNSHSWRDASPVRILLLTSTIVSLLVGSFLKSAIIYNDLGWRSILFAQVAAIVWTMWVAQSIRSLRALSPTVSILLILGFAGVLWDIVGFRLIRPSLFPTRLIQLNSHPKMDFALRKTYEWADHNLPEGAVLQNNPGVDARSLDFGLYGHHWPAVADRDAMLFGASRQAVAQRITLVQPIFNARLSGTELRSRAKEAKIDYLLFTIRDPIWRINNGPPQSIQCVYRQPLLCIGQLPSVASQ